MTEYGFEAPDLRVNVIETAERNILKETLEEAMGKLSEKQQRLIRAFYFSVKSKRAIAAESGISEQAVGQRLKTAHKKLKEILGEAFSF
jgi:RNA polymerase sigma factor (sigma-70 family)